jgi:hypothetical protein
MHSPLYAVEALDDADHLLLETDKTILLRPVRSPARAPVTPSPIRRVRSQGPPRQAFPLKTTSKRIGAGVKTVAHARRLILAADLFRRDTGGQNQCAKTVCEPQAAPGHQRGPLLVHPLNRGYAVASSIPCRPFTGTNGSADPMIGTPSGRGAHLRGGADLRLAHARLVELSAGQIEMVGATGMEPVTPTMST